MKLFLTADGENLKNHIDSSFGRCSFFLLYDTEDDSYEFIENIHKDEQAAVGAAVAQEAIDIGANAVISLNPGPRAFKMLKEAGLDVYHINSGDKLSDVLDSFLHNELIPLDSYLPIHK